MPLFHPPNFRLLDPTGITEGVAVAGIVAAVASAGVGAASAANQAKAQQSAANYNAQVASNNAQVAMWQSQQQQQEFAAKAYLTQQQGAQQTTQLDLRNNVLMARNIAAAASSGLTLSGSTDTSIAGSAANNDLDVLNSQYKTQLDAYQDQIGASTAAYNSNIQVDQYDDQSRLDVMEGRNAKTSGMYSEVGAGIGGAGQLGSVLSSPSNQSALTQMFY